jgi:anti-sigma regulatory factor (Ser/Thr protein kinase)
MEVSRPALLTTTQHVVVKALHSSQIAEARRVAVSLAMRQGFSDADIGKVAIVVTELATNVVKHGAGGEVLLRTMDADGLEVLALDRGPGMPSVEQCLRDGYSTAGSPGTGLGAVRRLAARFDIDSTPGGGTVAYAVLRGSSRSGALPAGAAIGVVAVPRPGEEVSGDAWAVLRRGRCVTLLVADGLGHGPLAAEASRAAVKTLHANPALAPGALVELMHAALRPTRGSALAIAEIDGERGVVTYCGVGNISGVLVAAGGAKQMVSHHGTAGLEARKIAEFTYPWSADGLLVLHSDGVATHWGLARHDGLAARHPTVIAGVLYRDFTRGRDDATVLVARMHERVG